MNKIEHKDLVRVNRPLGDMQDTAYIFKLKGETISIVKWSHKYYDGDYEIYSYETLFEDVERYSTMGEVLDRINQLRGFNV